MHATRNTLAVQLTQTGVSSNPVTAPGHGVETSVNHSICVGMYVT